jgi:hypothetical protein
VRTTFLEVPLQLAANELQQEGAEWSAVDVAAAAAEIEEALLEEHGGQTDKVYRQRARTLSFNLKVRACLRVSSVQAAYGWSASVVAETACQQQQKQQLQQLKANAGCVAGCLNQGWQSPPPSLLAIRL